MQPAKEKKKSNHFNKKYMIKTVKYVRMVVQLIFFVLLPSLFDQAFTGVKNTADAIGKGNVLQWDSFTKILLILLIVTLLFGRVFCGYACAFGALGDYIYFLTGKIRACINIKVKIAFLPVMHAVKTVRLALNPELKKKEVNAQHV